MVYAAIEIMCVGLQKVMYCDDQYFTVKLLRTVGLTRLIFFESVSAHTYVNRAFSTNKKYQRVSPRPTLDCVYHALQFGGAIFWQSEAILKFLPEGAIYTHEFFPRTCSVPVFDLPAVGFRHFR